MGAKFSDIGKIVKEAITSRTVLEEAAKVAVEAIPVRTRLGRGVPEAEGPSVALPQLKEKTKSNRKYLKKRGDLTGPNATPSKSGLNASGKLLTGLRYLIGKDFFEIRLADAEQEEKAQNLLKIDKGFQFMNLSNAEVNKVIKAMNEQIQTILKKIKFDSF